jgi:hypothetical protein
MKHAAVICGYVILSVGMPFALDASMYVDLAVISAITFMFAFAFVAWARGSALLALSIVVLLTVVLPAAGLLFIGSPVYASWIETIQVIWRASRETGPLLGFEWVIPLLSACLAAALAHHMRSNKPLQATREDALA